MPSSDDATRPDEPTAPIFDFQRMTPGAARAIADQWRYPAPYDFYDAASDPEDYEELVTPALWPEVMEQARRGDDVIGFLTAQRGQGEDDETEAVWELGLGMRPDLTGRGAGEDFVRACLARLGELRPGARRIVLDVAAFNERAIRVYTRVGFVERGRHRQDTNGGTHDFVRMELAAGPGERPRAEGQAAAGARRDAGAIADGRGPVTIAPAATLSAADLLALYDEQLRAAAEMWDAPDLVRIGPLWASLFPERRHVFVTYEPLPDGTNPAALVDAVVDRYAADERVEDIEWKLRGHDGVPGLEEALESHGFVLEETETVMAGEVEAVIAAGADLPAGYVLERAEDEAAVREAEALAGRVFGDTPEESDRRANELVTSMTMAPGRIETWFVRDAHGEVVCSGRLELVEGTDFAGLWGGACDAAHRGRGLYRALTAARARSARARGKRYVQVDCTEYSRPILQRAGLLAITTTTPAVWRRPGVRRPAA